MATLGALYIVSMFLRNSVGVIAPFVEPAARAEQWTESALVEGKQGEYQSGHV